IPTFPAAPTVPTGSATRRGGVVSLDLSPVAEVVGGELKPGVPTCLIHTHSFFVTHGNTPFCVYCF
ncbi:hypothetical protein BaRGS_00025258, partial [Batillaria attramentaria]